MSSYFKDSIKFSTICLSLFLMIIANMYTNAQIPNNLLPLILSIVLLHFGATGVFAHMIKNIIKSHR